ncbi:uncharacterized protein LOC126654671 [Mercurialis annua]|uniref:uncharacterized protein LOC126654671 n=1 Tax=Mercurialis annua TaxID=3986 RepID=UPI00215F9F69|nr:uncharacterized protein LOC126654671 [Mercurialis annua]
MSEFSISSKKIQFSSLLLSDLLLFCSFILSHPLYLFYFIFFFPYLFKLLSYLSPLFVTTLLSLLLFLTVSPNQLSESNLGTLYQALVDRLSSKVVEDVNATELEAYKIVFEASDYDIGETPVQFLAQEGTENSSTDDQDQARVSKGSSNENSVAITMPESTQMVAEVKTLGVYLHQKEETKEFASEKVEEEEEEKSVISSDFDKVETEHKEEEYIRSGSKARMDSNSWSSHENSPNLGSFGSMRKEKEWRRTLACKLFEERHNGDGSEGMDMLWETYESDAIKVQRKSKSKKGSIEYCDDDDEEDDDDEPSNGQLCCLQALKFSTRKMNLGMGKPNLVKISKALKGFGWLHHVSKGKKAYH